MNPKLMADMILIFRRSSMFNFHITRVGTTDKAKSCAKNMLQSRSTMGRLVELTYHESLVGA